MFITLGSGFVFETRPCLKPGGLSGGSDRLACPARRLRQTLAPLVVAEDKPFPEITLTGLNGAQAFRGKLLVLNVWASWCQPCRKEMPSLE